MSTTAAYLATQRARIGHRLRLLVGGPDQPALTGSAFLSTLTALLTDSGLTARPCADDQQSIVATAGERCERRILLLFRSSATAGDLAPVRNEMAPAEGDSATEYGGPRAALVAALAALEALLVTGQTLPIGVILVCETDRGTGSANLTTQRLPSADFCLWDGGGYTHEQAWFALGTHGLARIRLQASGPGGPIELGGLLVNPAWRIIWSLALLKSQNEELFPAELDRAVRTPTATELATLAAMVPALEDAFARRASPPLLGLHGLSLPLVQSFSPTLNVIGLGLDTRGPDSLPTTAWAELILSLVPHQTPAAVVTALTNHLVEHQLDDVGLELITGYAGWETPATDQFVTTASQLWTAQTGQAPLLLPFGEQPAPLARLAAAPGWPALGIGTGYAPWPTLEERVLAQAQLLATLLPTLGALAV